MLPIKAYAPSPFGQLHYRIVMPDQEARQPPLLCLHQTPSSSREWEPIQASLAKDRVVIAADTPGYGMSDPPQEPLEIGDYAEIMLSLMDHLADTGTIASGAFDVMGYHTGSITATELARCQPDRVRRGVLFGLAAYPAEARQEKLATLREKFPEPDRTLHHVEQLWSIICQLGDERMSAEHMHVAMGESLRLGSRLPWGYISVYRYDFLGAMADVAQPILVMNPEDDLWDVTNETAHLFRNGQRYDMHGVSHGVLQIEHDRVVDEIEKFLRS